MECTAEQLHPHQREEEHDEDSEDGEVEERDGQFHQHLQNELDTWCNGTYIKCIIM